MARFRRLSDLNPPILTADERWQYLLPGAPTGVTATAGNAQATVSWTAPASVVAITDYYVQYSSNGGSTWTTFSDGTSTATSATVTGLTNGTAYTFRVAAVSGIGQGPYSTASGSVTPGGDPLFAQVALLLHMDGSGSTFVDSSKYARAIAANGDVTQSTAQSQFGGKAAAFDGTGDALTIPYSSSLDLATGDFAIECWWYPTSTANGQTLFAFNGSGPYSQVRVDAYNDGSRYFRFLTQSGGDWISTAGGGAWNVNQWHHVAAVRTGSQFNLYINGTSAISFSSSGSLVNNSSGVAIGSLNGGNYWVSGYIDEFRATVGHNRGYTGSTITVPTAAFPDA
jgi:hypothetical protein